MEFSVSTTFITALFDIDKSTLTRWKKLGAEDASLGRNEWDLKVFMEWWLRNIYQPVDENEPTLQAEKLRYEKGRADRIEIEVCKLRGNLIERAEVARLLVERATEFRRALLGLSRRLALRLANKTSAEIQAALDEEAVEILRGYSRPNPLTDAPKPKKGKTDAKKKR